MNRIRIASCTIAVLIALLAIYFVLRSEQALLVHPKGLIAARELKLIAMNIHLMLLVVLPTLGLFFFTAWKFRAKNRKAKYDPDHSSRGSLGELILWIIPACIIAPMAILTWVATHELDPYRPLGTSLETFKIQVVALDWKWLFIYPEQGIATVNFVQFPEKTPIHFELAADGSPMNSFWIPELSGQIYAMTGMVTPLHLMADGSGVYKGRAAEINGRGYADMAFIAKSTSHSDFDDWVLSVKESPFQLSGPVYEELIKPSINPAALFYSHVEEGLFNKIVMKYMHHDH